MKIWPLFGAFRFDLYGYTAYAYSLVVLFLIYGGFTFWHWFGSGANVNVTTHS